MKENKFERFVEERQGALPTAVLDAVEAAAYLAITKDNLYKIVRADELPHVRVGRSIRFRVQDLDTYLERGTSRYWERVDNRGRPPRKRRF